MTTDELRKILRETGHVAEIDLEPTVKALSSLLPVEKAKAPPAEERPKQIIERVQAIVSYPEGNDARPVNAKTLPAPTRVADIYANPDQ